MEFPINMTGYAQGLHLFRCICSGCGGEYFLHPRANLIADSGMCPICEDLVRQVDACSGEPVRAPRFQFLPVAPAPKELKRSEAWTTIDGVVGVLMFLLSLYGLYSLLEG